MGDEPALPRAQLPPMKSTFLPRLRVGLLVLLAPLTAWGYPPPPPTQGEPPSTVPPAVQQLRRAMLDPEVNSLTFHNMDQLFTTRTVPRSGPVWSLPRA